LALPDWASWLPQLHPLDIWPPASAGAPGLFESGYQGKTPLDAYAAIQAWFAANGADGASYGEWSALSAGLLADITKPVDADHRGMGADGPDRPQSGCGAQPELCGR